MVSRSDVLARAPTEGETLIRANWITRLQEHGKIHGFHRVLDRRHGALFTEDDDTLLVSFESAGQMRASPVGLPWALTVAGREGWSHLGLYCEGNTFFRAPAVYQFFDKLIDDGFFDQFERVVFFGAGSCGYAAAAFSVVAPGSTALLVRPLATLDPARTEWDGRYPRLRRTDFGNRYGYAPDMLEAARNAFVLYDPSVAEDATHAMLFDRPNVRRLKCRYMGPSLERELDAMEILAPMLRAAGKGDFTPSKFHALFRRRHSYPPYLRRILARLRTQDRPVLLAHWSRGVRASLQASGSQRANG